MKKIKDLFRAEAASPTATAMLHNGSVGFRIPEYQRQYDWSEANITRLFYDCLIGFYRLGNSGGADAFTFLGTLILVDELEQEENFKGASVAVVDGQQRLTTLTLLACALYESLEQLKAPISGLSLSDDTRRWLLNEAQSWQEVLLDCAVGFQRLSGKTMFAFPRIVRSGDSRGYSAQYSEYRSAVAKFLFAFADFPDSGETEFAPPALGTGSDATKLGANFALIRDLVSNLNNTSWYDDTECEQVPIGWVTRSGYKDLFEKLDDTIKSDGAQQAALSSLAHEPNSHSVVRLILFAAYFARCIVLTRVTTDDESAAFDIFDALNTTGEPLTALETLKPRAIQYERGFGAFESTPAASAFSRLKEYVDEKFPRTDQKQAETKDLIVTFALFIEGAKLGEHLAAQRTFLRTRYDQAISGSRANSQRFLTSLADLAEFRHFYWTKSGIEELGRFHSPASMDEVQLLMSFARDMKTSLVLPILARYWRSDLKQHGEAEFIEVLRAVIAFLVLRRAASGTTSGIDSDFRAIMAPKSGSKKFGLLAGVKMENPKLTPAELKQAFKTLLEASKQKIATKEKWVGQVVDNPLYAQSKELVRFMLLAAGDRAAPSSVCPGGWTKDGLKQSDNTNNFFRYAMWISKLYATVEHVAPDSEPPSGWDKSIYKNNILRHSIGNLCLLPLKENGAIGNGSWQRKQLFYRALTERTVKEQELRFAEAKAQGMEFKSTTIELLKGAQFLPLLDPLRAVVDWTPDVIRARGENAAELVWDKFWPWLN